MALDKSIWSSIYPKGQLMGSHMVGWEDLFIPTTFGWTMGSRVNGKLSARKVIHPNLFRPYWGQVPWRGRWALFTPTNTPMYGEPYIHGLASTRAVSLGCSMASSADPIWAIGAPGAHQRPTSLAGSHPLPGVRGTFCRMCTFSCYFPFVL